MENTTMEKLPKHGILRFHFNSIECIRKEYNFDKPGQMDAAIDILNDWVKKQAHFTKKNFPREYLERAIILDKGSVERAKNQIEKLFTMRTLVPHFFEKTDPRNKDFERVRDYYMDAVLPVLTKDHQRIYIAKVLRNDFNTKLITCAFYFGTLILEHLRMNDYCSGYIAIIDYRNINAMEVISRINFSELHQFVLYLREGYQVRVKSIHLLTSSKVTELLFSIIKQVFSKKITDRIRAHMTLESLHEHVPKELLPRDFGGEQKSLVELNRDWVDELSKPENIENFKEMRQAKVDENLRPEDSKRMDDLLGISGSFRTLVVD